MPLRLSRGQAKARTRRHLLAAAAQVFAEQGFAGASVDEIASRAGRTVGALYANFAGKDDLFRALFEEHLPHPLDVTGGIPSQCEDSAAWFAAFGTYMAELADQHTVTSTLEMEFLRYARTRPELLGRLAERWRAPRTAVARLLPPHDTSHDASHTTSRNASAVATVVIGLFEGLVVQRRADPGAVPPELFAQALRWLMTGLEHESDGGAPGERFPGEGTREGREEQASGNQASGNHTDADRTTGNHQGSIHPAGKETTGDHPQERRTAAAHTARARTAGNGTLRGTHERNRRGRDTHA
ncbi:TetR/AcrR family transcriptional regulator [Streptosporangium sp. NPDC051023]|uniref:TetR/AcrR family transcriptional regulator n=1 Tax=Streptosporangium sp. NPDC051023 TaxID=3155410 RepID=UPI00344FC124